MHQNKLTHLSLLAAAIVIVLMTAGCGGQYLKGATEEEFLKTSEPVTERLLKAIETRDYTLTQPDFTPKLTGELTEEKFLSFADNLNATLGQYQSRELYHINTRKDYTTVVYKMKYGKTDKAVLNLNFSNTTPDKISGIRFTAPGLQ